MTNATPPAESAPIVSNDALRKAFEANLIESPEDKLREIVRKHAPGGGLRPNAPRAILVAHILQRCGALTVHSPLAEACLAIRPATRLIATLRPDAIYAHTPELAAAVGPAPFFLALLQNKNEDLRDWGGRQLANLRAEDLPDPETARKDLYGLLEAIGAPTAKAVAQNGQIRDLKTRIAELEKELKKAHAETQAERNRAEREIKHERAQLDFHLDKRDREIARLNAQIARAEREREARVAQEVSANLISAFRGWLAPAIHLEETAQANAAAPLLDRVEKALADQARYDRASSAAAKAQADLRAIETALRRVDTALAIAQAKCPTLLDVREELVAERARLRGLLADAADLPANLTAARLRGVIQASRESQQAALEDLLERAKQFRLIDNAEHTALCRDLRRRQALWGIEVADKDADKPQSPTDEASAIAQRNRALARGLRGAAPLLLFLDGHNILNGLSRYRVARGDARDHETSRKLLEADIAALVRDLPLVSARLVWDGATRSDHTLAANLHVHYSGGEGEHRADRYLLDLIGWAKKSRADATPCVLVSNDNDFQAEAKRLGAIACRLDDFTAFLNAALHA